MRVRDGFDPEALSRVTGRYTIVNKIRGLTIVVEGDAEDDEWLREFIG